MRRGRRVKSDGALAATSSHDDADEDGEEGHRTPPKPRMSVRAVEEREETAGLLARIDEINEEKEKLIGQLKQQQVAGITDDFDEKPTRILAAGALHGLRSNRLPPSRESSEGQALRGLSALERQQLLELVNRRKSARGATASTSAASASTSASSTSTSSAASTSTAPSTSSATTSASTTSSGGDTSGGELEREIARDAARDREMAGLRAVLDQVRA